MLIVQRYYLKEFLKILAIVAAGLAFIFSMLDLIDKIDDFLPHRPPLEKLLLYTLLNFPRYLLYLLPMAALLCSLFIFSQAKRREEITIIRASGGRIKVLLIPFITVGFFLSILGFMLGEFIVPESSKRAHELRDAISKKDKKFSFKEGIVWLRAADGSIVKIGIYQPQSKTSKYISIFKTGDGTLKERIEAEYAEWEGGWKLKKVITYDIQKGSIDRREELEYPLIESPAIFEKGIQKPEEMGISELFRYTKRLKEAGFKNLKLTVDLNAKISYPLINLFMVLLGVSLPMRGKTGGGLVTTAIGIFISLLYWFGHAMSLSLGYTGILPPVVATWLVPTVFGIIAINLFSGIHE
jgi:lipopolysaccharide export system permease protein